MHTLHSLFCLSYFLSFSILKQIFFFFFFLVGLGINQVLLSAMDNLDLSISIAQEEGTDTVFGFNQNKEK